MEYHFLNGHEISGDHGSFGVKIYIAATNLSDLKKIPELYDAGFEAENNIMAALDKILIDNDPNTKQIINNNRKLIDLFPDHIFVEELPNGYCSDYCYAHLPWFKVTTKIGHFIIGWRKRIISIDWGQTVGTKTAEELFGDEDVTLGGKMIHAWSLENAQRYIDTIMGNIKS